MGNCFGNNIRRYRESLNLSQIKFAEKINAVLRNHGKTFDYTNRSISKWENGDTMPSLDIVLAVSEMTGIGLDELFKDDITEFKKQFNNKCCENKFRHDDGVYGEYYDLQYLFVKEALKNIFKSNYTPHGIFRANTIILQKTALPIEPKEPYDEYAAEFRKHPPPLILDDNIDDETILKNYNWQENMYGKIMVRPLSFLDFSNEIIQLDTLMKQEWLHGKVAAILYNYGTCCYNGELLTEGQPPFLDDNIVHKTTSLQYAYRKIVDDICEPGGLLLAAVKSELFSSKNARLKQLFKKECPNQLRARENLLKLIPAFHEINTTYFIYDKCVYAKHSIKIEMSTAEFEKLYKEHISFIEEVPLIKEYSNLITED